MEIRPDFRATEPLLQRLAGIGAAFADLNNKNWSHLKNREDFRRVYLLPYEQKAKFEDLYAKGRECAILMGDHLQDFNNVVKFPTFADYVDSFSSTWAYEDEDLRIFLDQVKGLAEKIQNPPWAVLRMIDIFEQQLRLLGAVRGTVEILKESHTYLVDKGKASMEKPGSITIGSVNGKVNINSIDNSANYTFNSSPVFLELADAISESDIEPSEKAKLLSQVEQMKKTEGTSSFTQKYKEFIQNAANHIAVVTPFLPALAAVLV